MSYFNHKYVSKTNLGLSLSVFVNWRLQGGAEGGGDAQPRSRAALRDLLLEEYEGTGLHRKLSPLDVQV
jgi:hypothetical protein